MRVPFLSLLLAAVAAPLVTADEAPGLAAEAAAFHEKSQEPNEGIVMGRVRDGKMAFGSAGLSGEGRDPVGPDTLFEIGSITKVFTGILLADAVLRERAALDDPVASFLPDDLLASSSPLQSITLGELATHTSGLPRLPGNLDQGANPRDPYAHYDEDRLLEFLADFEKSDLEKPGEVAYSNLGAGLLGYLLGRISDKPYEELLAETVFEPLGMNDSFVQRRPGDVPQTHRARYADGHARGKPAGHWHIDALCGAGAIVSTPRDLLRFAEAQWSRDTPGPLAKAMGMAREKHAKGVGLGWFRAGGRFVHDGGTGGFRSEIRVDPEEKTATVQLRNSTEPVAARTSEGEFAPIEGYWSGTLGTGDQPLRLFFRISESGRVIQHSLDQTKSGMVASETRFHEGEAVFAFSSMGGKYTATHEGDSLVGTWKQGREFDLALHRADKLPAELRKFLKGRTTGDLSGLTGFWSGTLGGKKGLFLILEIEAIEDFAEVRLFSPDQTDAAMPVTRLSFENGTLELELKAVRATYQAELDDGHIEGTWDQGAPMPLRLERSETWPKR